MKLTKNPFTVLVMSSYLHIFYLLYKVYLKAPIVICDIKVTNIIFKFVNTSETKGLFSSILSMITLCRISEEYEKLFSAKIVNEMKMKARTPNSRGTSEVKSCRCELFPSGETDISASTTL